ncbi:MAG TPA: helix-hairpin-helix domain-containing protein [Vicinamibacterales bacterium]|nr:helix-hairpin-helix domain-containing protein [Vicinamibacterales bacterium]
MRRPPRSATDGECRHREDLRRGDLLQIQGANPFRIRAYRTAPRAMETLGEPAAQLAAPGDGFDELPGI